MAELRCAGQIRMQTFSLEVPSVCLPATGVTVLFGASGSGKSTFMKAVAGVLRASAFEVYCGEQPWQTRHHWLPPQQREIGMVQQQGVLFEHMQVEALLRFPLKYARRQLFTFEQVVQWLGLSNLLHHRPGQLSGGQRQRVALGQALLRQPRWLFLDEPLVGLDRQARQEMLTLLERVVKVSQLPTLLVTHALDEVERLGDQVLFMAQGRVYGEQRDQQQIPVSIWQAVSCADSPLFSEQDPVALLQGELLKPRNTQGLAEVRVGRHILFTCAQVLPVGAVVRVRIAARQILLAQERLMGVSALNQLALEVSAVYVRENQALVKLALDENQVLWATVTHASVKALDLAPGRRIWVVIKAVAIL